MICFKSYKLLLTYNIAENKPQQRAVGVTSIVSDMFRAGV